MQQLLDPTLEVVAKAKAAVQQSSARLLHLLSFVPDDKLNWSPAESSRSSLQIVAHCGLTSGFFAQIIRNEFPAVMPSPQEIFAEVRAQELAFTTRESVIELVEKTTAELCAALDTVTDETIDAIPNCPFGPMTTRFWMSVGGSHCVSHAGQLEYLQTIWGDLDPHFAG
jgi:hypothetical protein